MGNFQQDQRDTERKRARIDRRKEKEACQCFDIAKLCLGGMVIGAFVPLLSNESASIPWWLAGFGIAIAMGLIFIGHNLVK